MNPTLDMIHAELERAGGLTGREAATLLKLHQVHINERQFRHYMTGKSVMPETIYRALVNLADELELLSDSAWDVRISAARLH